MIYDNIISCKRADEIESYLFSYDFPWYYYNQTVIPNDQIITAVTTPEVRETPQLVHMCYYDGVVRSKFYGNVLEIVSAYNVACGETNVRYNIHRAKANLIVSYGNANEYHTPHADVTSNSGNYTTLLYYVNTTSGDTIFFDKKLDGISAVTNLNIVDRVSPVKNRLVVFNSDQVHASSSPIFPSKGRAVINIVIEKKYEKK